MHEQKYISCTNVTRINTNIYSDFRNTLKRSEEAMEPHAVLSHNRRRQEDL